MPRASAELGGQVGMDTIVIVPSTAVESMQMGGFAGMTALTMGLGQESISRRKKQSSTVRVQLQSSHSGSFQNQSLRKDWVYKAIKERYP
jgi:hypothetical protein